MKRYLLLSAAWLGSLIFFSSCNDDSSSNGGFNGLSAVGISGVRTTVTDNYNNWQAAPTVLFNNTGANFDHWLLNIGNSQGYFRETTSGNENHWKGEIHYSQKHKKKDDTVYLDSLRLDVTNNNESAWNKASYSITSYVYDKKDGPSNVNSTVTTYYIQPDSAGNINSLGVYDQYNIYQFSFKTTVRNNFNTWTIKGIQNGWMNEQGKISMLVVPILYTLFQH